MLKEIECTWLLKKIKQFWDDKGVFLVEMFCYNSFEK